MVIFNGQLWGLGIETVLALFDRPGSTVPRCLFLPGQGISSNGGTGLSRMGFKRCSGVWSNTPAARNEQPTGYP